MDACQIFNRDLCYIHCWSMFQRSQITSADFWTAPTHLTYGRGMFNVPQHFFILVTNMTKNSECITLVSCINLVKQGCTFSFDYSFIAILSCVFYSGNDIDLANDIDHCSFFIVSHFSGSDFVGPWMSKIGPWMSKILGVPSTYVD